MCRAQDRITIEYTFLANAQGKCVNTDNMVGCKSSFNILKNKNNIICPLTK